MMKTELTKSGKRARIYNISKEKIKVFSKVVYRLQLTGRSTNDKGNNLNNGYGKAI